MKEQGNFSDALTVGQTALASYKEVLSFLAGVGRQRQRGRGAAERPFLGAVEGLSNLYDSMSAVAPAVPGTELEEWNPLSQRPHAPLPPPVTDELGAEITTLKEAIDGFTTLAHEMMHVALWEPFFVGRWKPKSQKEFREFSLRAEGFSFFFSDVIVSGAVRARLPDGEFALERRTPSNAHFHPVRAFQSLGIDDPAAILDIYLNGFAGGRTQLAKTRGSNNYASALAARVHEFYVGSQGYLNDAYVAMDAFGCFSEFYKGFCEVPGLPTFLTDADELVPKNGDFNSYFKAMYTTGIAALAKLSPQQIDLIRSRRMLQMRAYYALQVRWLLSEGKVIGRGLTKRRVASLVDGINVYLDDLSDQSYQTVRARLLAHHAWAGQRWLIAPRRAGGMINVCESSKARGRAAKIELLQTVAFIVDELTRRMKASKTVEERAEVLVLLQKVASLGATANSSKSVAAASRKLRTLLTTPGLRGLWSVPLASFDPANNHFRELVFSYQ